MANVLELMGKLVDPFGSPLTGKTVKLYNDDTGAYLGGTYPDVATDVAGKYTFTAIDETLNVRAVGLAGGSSADQHWKTPFSGQAVKLYVTTELRTRAGSAAIFGGTLSVAGALTLAPATAANASVELGYTGGTASTPFIDFHSGAAAVDYDSRLIASGGSGVAGGGTLDVVATVFTKGGQTIWHAGNDGAASGLDADLLDGINSAQFARLDAASNFTVAPTIGGGTVWHSLNDGAGSGLDADLLDGLSSASFSLAGHDHAAAYVDVGGDTMTGVLFINETAGFGALRLIDGGSNVTRAGISGRTSGVQRGVDIYAGDGTTGFSTLARFALDKITLGVSSNAGNTEIYASSATPLHVFRYTNNGDLIAFFRDGTFIGNITTSDGTTVQYLAFLGAHPAPLLPYDPEPPPHGLVESCDPVAGGRFPSVRAARPGSGAVYGVWAGFRRDGDPLHAELAGYERVGNVDAVGLGQVRVCDQGGDIFHGDPLMASDHPFEATAATPLDDASYFGTARSTVVWDDIPYDPDLGYRWTVIPCTLHCG